MFCGESASAILCVNLEGGSTQGKQYFLLESRLWKGRGLIKCPIREQRDAKADAALVMPYRKTTIISIKHGAATFKVQICYMKRGNELT